MDVINEGKKVFDIEIEALKKTRDSLGESFIEILEAIRNCHGKVIITGMGKPGHIATKVAATFSSLGVPSFFLHPGEAMHGDLGMIQDNDVVIAVSYSGESDEILGILPNIKMIGPKLIGVTANKDSTLAKACDIVHVLPKFEEACSLGLAPTSSTTATLCFFDALAVVNSNLNHFSEQDFGKYHPAGALGKKIILRVENLMNKGEKNSLIKENAPLKDAIIELSKKGLGAVTVIDDNNNILGIITDGDLRRQLEKGSDIYSLKIKNVMKVNPYTISPDALAIDALKEMKKLNVSCLVVAENNKAVGTIRIQDIIGVGIVA